MATLTVGTENTAPVELYYEDHGDDRPLVLVPGWPWGDACWEPQVPALVSAGYRTVTYHRRGSGRSGRPWDGYDYNTLAADLYGLITRLDLRDVTLVGCAMGTGEITRLLARHDDGRVTRAVFVSTATPYLYRSYDNPTGALDDADIARLADGVRADRPAVLDRFATEAFHSGDRTLLSEARRAYLLSLAAAATPKGTLDSINTFARTDLRTDLRRIGVPVLVVHGGADAVLPLAATGQPTHDAIPGSRLVVLDPAPHALTLTHPVMFNRVLLDFLRE